jgi:5'-3' exonuclease
MLECSWVTNFDTVRVERFKQSTKAKLRGVRCPEHHQPPRLHFQGVSLRDITVSMSGCCEKLMELANARIASATTEAEIRKPA